MDDDGKQDLEADRADSTPMGPPLRSYCSQIVTSTIGATTSAAFTPGLKRKRPDSDVDTKAIAKTYRLTDRLCNAETQISAVSRFRAANINSFIPSERPFPFPKPPVTKSVYDSSNATAIPPAHPLLQPPPYAERLPTGLASNPLLFRNFYSGLILSVPWFEIAMNREADPAKDGNFVYTKNGIVCAKRRMAIVLWTMGNESVLVLPISSRTGRGLGSLRQDAKTNRICLKNWKDDHFRNESAHPPLIVSWMSGKAMGDHSSVNLATAGTILYGVEMTYVGYLSRLASRYMVEQYQKLQRESQEAMWI